MNSKKDIVWRFPVRGEFWLEVITNLVKGVGVM